MSSLSLLSFIDSKDHNILKEFEKTFESLGSHISIPPLGKNGVCSNATPTAGPLRPMETPSIGGVKAAATGTGGVRSLGFWFRVGGVLLAVIVVLVLVVVFIRHRTCAPFGMLRRQFKDIPDLTTGVRDMDPAVFIINQREHSPSSPDTAIVEVVGEERVDEETDDKDEVAIPVTVGAMEEEMLVDFGSCSSESMEISCNEDTCSVSGDTVDLNTDGDMEAAEAAEAAEATRVVDPNFTAVNIG